MNFTKNMTTLLSFALLFSSVSLFSLPSAPAWMNRDNAKAAGSKLFSWMPTIALGGYCVHLALRMKALEAKKAAAVQIDAEAVAGALVNNETHILKLSDRIAAHVVNNVTFRNDVVTTVRDGLFTQEQPKFVVKSLLKAGLFNQNGELFPAGQMNAWLVNPRGAAHSQEKEQE